MSSAPTAQLRMRMRQLELVPLCSFPLSPPMPLLASHTLMAVDTRRLRNTGPMRGFVREAGGKRQ